MCTWFSQSCVRARAVGFNCVRTWLAVCVAFPIRSTAIRYVLQELHTWYKPRQKRPSRVWQYLCIFDDMAGQGRESATFKGVSPCITKSRASGFWLSSCQRKYHVFEMGRLQGLPSPVIRSLLRGGTELHLACSIFAPSTCAEVCIATYCTHRHNWSNWGINNQPHVSPGSDNLH